MPEDQTPFDATDQVITLETGLPGSKKLKNAKFGHKQFQEDQV